MLKALARGDTNGNGFVELSDLTGYVDSIVPEITDRQWHVRQFQQKSVKGIDFPLAKQLPSLSTDGGRDIIVSTKPTHVLPEGAKVFAAPGGAGTIVQELGPFALVTLVKTVDGWVLVAKEGTALGFVAEASLKLVQ